MSDAIFIVGYYRSGTSALSGALQRLGVALHNDADANEHNPLGFYEIPELIEFDVDLFNRLGVQWTDVRPLEDGWWNRADMAPYLSRVAEILRRRFKGESLWGIKHPHLCRLLPLYERAAAQAQCRPHVIHICREPWTVAASQQRKNGLSRSHALLLWASYLVSAERHARGLPRAWLTYQDLLARPSEQIRRIERELGLEFAGRVPHGLREASAFLTGQLNRSEPLPKAGLLPALHELVESMWQAILARDFSPDAWQGFSSRCAELVGFVAELGASQGPILPWLSISTPRAALGTGDAAALRPAERLDAGGKERLLALMKGAGTLPSLAVVIAAPPNRAHAVNDTLESLRAQWHGPASVRILSSDAVEIPEHTTVRVSDEAGALTAALCDELAMAAAGHDYVAVLNAGDTVAPDACLRFALEAAATRADLIYCDEAAPRDGGHWVRHKPAWDITRLRQSPFLGDWIWYRAETFQRIGGFDARRAGAEEYDYQLRLAEATGRVVRLPETLFTRASLSRRDNIPSTVFLERAAEAVTAHLARSGIPAVVEQRQHLGLYRHVREAADPGTSTILLCDGAEIAMLDAWLKTLLTGSVLTGPIILAGAALSPQATRYLTQVAAQIEALEHKVLAVPPAAGLQTGDALRRALALATTEHVAIIDVRSLTATPDWQNALRARLADGRVALVGARSLAPVAGDKARLSVQGPIVIGAEARMGAAQLADDPGPGGWLAVDQEASAVAPPALLARRATLARCAIPSLSGDPLWIDLCAQLRAAGNSVVWTPDVSFVIAAQTIQPDSEGRFRGGSETARTLSWEDPYHHPALSLRGDLLAPEKRQGLVRAAPTDPISIMLSGPADAGRAVLNAARGLRARGVIEASWAPEPMLPAEISRRAPSYWVRLNPTAAAPAHSPSYTGLFTTTPKDEAKPAIAAAAHLVATSPALVAQVRKLAAPGRSVELWRPTLCHSIWADLQIGTGINSKPRLLWIDEGREPTWLKDLINETLSEAMWIVVARPGGSYSGSITTIQPPETEQAWAAELGAVAPHILVRPADRDASADHYVALLAAAVGCHLLVDERLDLPEALGAIRLPNRIAAWQRAVKQGIGDFHGTLQLGRKTRAACLALAAGDGKVPDWAGTATLASLTRSAAE